MTDLVSLKRPIEKEILVRVYDLTGLAQSSRSKTSREVVQVMSDFYSMTQTGVKQAKGLLIKFIGDAGLCVFPRDVASEAIEAMINMKFTCDDWLKKSIGKIIAPSASKISTIGNFACVCTINW